MKKAKLIRSKRKRNFSLICDADYLDKLSPEDRAWRLKFDNEYYRGSNLRSPDSIHQDHKHVLEIEENVRRAENEVYLSLDVDTLRDAVDDDPTDLLIAAYDLENEKPPKR